MYAPRSLVSGIGRFAIDVPVAALAGLSVAFLAFAAPGDAIADLVAATGLSSLVPAAEPPLGLKARIGLAAVGALIVFAGALFVLRWLDRLGSPRAANDEPADPAQPPRLRRRDLHPDAPPRPPIMATYELGEPLQSRPVPSAAGEPGVAPRPESAEEEEWLLDDPTDPAEPMASEPPQPAAPPVLEATAPAFTAPDPFPAEREVAPAFAAADPFPEAREPAPIPPVAPPPPAGGNLDELMARLEQGLARCRPAPPPPAAAALPDAPSAPEPFPRASDDRLQSAIENLQRLAGRGD